jgi:hypothetical protein
MNKDSAPLKKTIYWKINKGLLPLKDIGKKVLFLGSHAPHFIYYQIGSQLLQCSQE